MATISALAARALFVLIAQVRGDLIPADADIGWELMVTSASPEVPKTCFEVSLPPSVVGLFFISGPAVFEMGGIRYNSHFDGYGRANKFELRENEVCWTSKMINSAYWQAARKLGEIGPGVLFDDTTPERPSCGILHPMCDLKAPMDNNWVNILPLEDNGLLITDGPVMLDFDFESMNVSGPHEWQDNPDHGVTPSWIPKFHMPAAGSAHPVLRPGTKSTYINLMSEVGMTGSFSIDLYSIDVSIGQKRSLVARVPVNGLQYFHSYGVSKNYVVLPCNIRMGIKNPLKRPYLLDSFEEGWDGIKVIEMDTGKVQNFDTDKFFHVHVVNTFENETGVVMDLGTMKSQPFSRGPVLSIDSFLNKTARDERGPNSGSVTERIHLHLAGPSKGTVTREVFTDPKRNVDFFKINNLFNGLPYCIYYAVEWFHDDKAYASMAILKHDICTSTKTYWHRPFTYVGEPFFIPGESGAEDDGHVIFVALDGQRRASDLVILDGKTFEEVSVTKLPSHIPFLAHGQFFKRSLKSAEAALQHSIIV